MDANTARVQQLDGGPGQSGMNDCQGSRPDNLLAGVRKFPDDPGRSNMWSPCSNCSSSDENNSPTALNTFNWDKPALEDKSVDFGWSTPNKINKKLASSRTAKKHKNDDQSTGGYVNMTGIEKKHLLKCHSPLKSPKREQELLQSCGSVTDSPNTTTEQVPTAPSTEIANTSDPDTSLEDRSEQDIEKEREELRNVAWFQAGIPREIALEVLSEKPEGSFIVRSSTTKPGCYALSLRVPQTKNPTGIAHYLILQTNKGYKIKGFTKEFSSLNSLITHHSVMPELLPCPLNMSRSSTRDAEREFEETEQKKCDIFSDIHWLMTDLEV